MECKKCGCPLIEGVSAFCPECGTPVNNQVRRASTYTVQKIVLTVFLALSVLCIFLPYFRIAKDSYSSISVFGLSFGFASVGKMHVGAFPYLAALFVIPQAACIALLWQKKLNIHTIYSIIGVIQLVFSLIYLVLWIALMLAGTLIQYLGYTGGYGVGIVASLVFALVSAFLCIAFSAAQDPLNISRSEKWFITVNWLQLIFGIIFLAVYAFVFFTNKMILEDYLFSVTKILSLLLLILASAKMIKKDYSQWMLYIGYAIVSGVSNVFFAINSGYLLKCILDDDAFKIYDMIEPYLFIFAALAAAGIIYSVIMCVWSCKTLKRTKKVFRLRNSPGV